MSRTLWIALVIGACTLPVMAQGFGGFNLDERLEQAKEELGLTDEQVEKMRGVYDEFMQGMMDFRNNPGDGDFRTRMQEMREKMESQLGEFLTEEQQEQLRGMMGRGQRQRGERDPAQRDARNLRRAVERMQLTETEAGIVTEAIETMMAKKRELQGTVQEKRRALNEAIDDEASSDESIAKLMEEVRVADEEATKGIDAAETELRELLTLRQQGVLVGLGILRYGTNPVY